MAANKKFGADDTKRQRYYIKRLYESNISSGNALQWALATSAEHRESSLKNLRLTDLLARPAKQAPGYFTNDGGK